MPHGNLEPDEFDRALDSVLRRRPEARVPPGFAARALARLPREQPTVLPYAVAAAAIVFVVLAGFALQAGWLAEAGRKLSEAVAHRTVIAAIAGLELAGSLVWLWRAARA